MNREDAKDAKVREAKLIFLRATSRASRLRGKRFG
jgi:hypothetical protein